jgi:hypothetical protein
MVALPDWRIRLSRCRRWRCAMIGCGLSPASPLARQERWLSYSLAHYGFRRPPFNGRSFIKAAFLLAVCRLWLMSQRSQHGLRMNVAALLLPGILALVLVSSREGSDANDAAMSQRHLPRSSRWRVWACWSLYCHIGAIYPQAATHMVLAARRAGDGGRGWRSIELEVVPGLMSVLAPARHNRGSAAATGVAVAVLLSSSHFTGFASC